MIDYSKFGTVPREHQKVATAELIRHDNVPNGRVIPDVFLLADDVGVGKSKEQIDASSFVYDFDREIDTCVCIAPAQGRPVWANPDPNIGEVAKHGWPNIDNYVLEYSVNYNKLQTPPPGHLTWLATNYEFVRRDERLLPLLKYLVNRRFWLICDEAWALSDAQTDQWKAIHKIRKLAKRVTLLNGTPITDNPLDTFGQFKMLDWRILGFKYFTHFRARYAILRTNVNFPQVLGWQNLEELRERARPYTLARMMSDCWDLPEVLEPVTIEVKLSQNSWRIYCQMRDDMLAWLDAEKGVASVASQAMVRGMRLAQITSGFIGGVQAQIFDEDALNFGETVVEERNPNVPAVVHEIGTEKVDGVRAWLNTLRPAPKRLLFWSRFRPEIERTARIFEENGGCDVYKLYGGQTESEREAALRALNPAIIPPGYVKVVGNPLAGGAAVNLAGANYAITMSRDTKLRVHKQGMGRIWRPGQTEKVTYVDVVACGPKGQRTVDHHFVAALRAKEDIAMWTTATWSRKLREE